MMLIIVFVVTLIIFVYINIVKPHKFFANKNVPHVKPIPIIGNFAPIVFRTEPMADLLIRFAKKFENHRYFGLYQFLQPSLVLTDPDLIKQIGIKDFEYFLDHRGFVSEELDPLFGKNLFSLKGQKWRHMRSTLSPAFTSTKMKQMFVLISECADEFTDHFARDCKKNKHITVEMKDIFTRYANDVIATCAFGIKCDSMNEKQNEFYLNAKRATDFDGIRSLKFFGYSISPLLMELFKVRLFDLDTSDFFRNVVMGTIKTREEQGIFRPDLINILMEAKKGKLKYDETVKAKEEDTGFATVEESEVGKEEIKEQQLTDDELTAQALLFFFAGFDTTSTLMSHMAQELAVNPEIQEKLQDEIDAVRKKCNGKVTYEELTKMKYMDMVVSESLRKWPPAPMLDRLCTKDYVIPPVNEHEQELILNRGDHIWVNVYAVHRNPKYYPNPDKFDPERFSDENKGNILPGSYMAFGIGPRNCIGSRFALLGTKLVFYYLLSKINIVIDAKSQVPLKLTKSNINPLAEKGFWLGLEPRKNVL